MATAFSGNVQLTGSFTLDGGLANRAASMVVSPGVNDFPTLTATYTDGTGSNQGKNFYATKATIAASGNLDIDLRGSVTNDLGGTLNATHVKELWVVVDSPDGTKKVRVGPQNVSNGWQGPHGGTGASNYVEVFDWQRFGNPWAGWAVTAGTADILRINNPGAGSVDVHVIVVVAE